MAASLDRPYCGLGPRSWFSSAREVNFVEEGVAVWTLEARLTMRTWLVGEAVFLRRGRRCEVRITWAMWFIAICGGGPVSGLIF